MVLKLSCIFITGVTEALERNGCSL